jgi:hypothetical protein
MGLIFCLRLALAVVQDNNRAGARLVFGLVAMCCAVVTSPASAQQNAALTLATQSAPPAFGLFGPAPIQSSGAPTQPPAVQAPSPCTFANVSSPDDVKALIVKIASEE